jgi:hypothetical protein
MCAGDFRGQSAAGQQVVESVVAVVRNEVIYLSGY